MFRALVCLLLTTLCLQADVLARPNLVLIVADDLDQNLGTLDFMPNLHRLLVPGASPGGPRSRKPHPKPPCPQE